MVLGSLLEASHRLPPDEVPPTVASHAAAMGMADAALYLVDLDQRLLAGLAGEDHLEIDATVAGQAFRTEQVTEEPAPGGVRLWVPLMDGAERVGVLGVTIEQADADTRRRARHVASIAAELIVSKSSYGDNLVVARRLRDMDLAAELRWATLPPLTYTSDRVSISGLLEPAYEIAGDAFDYAVNGDVAHLAVVDAMGHGLEASRMANLAIASYRHSRRRGLDLIGTFRAMDGIIADQFGPERFVTGQLGRLHLDSGRLAWVNAGHPRPLLLRGGELPDELRGETCLPFGLGSVPAEAAEVRLVPGDIVLFMTDGVLEARSPEGHLFGRSRLARLLVEAVASGDVPAEMMRRLCHSVLDHQRGRLQDDASLLLVLWSGPAEPRAVPG